jgi:hypothetical protein
MRRTLAAAAGLVAALFLAPPAFSGDRDSSEGHSAGHVAKEATRDVGHATRDVARSVGHAAREITRDIGHAFRRLGKKLSEDG